MRQQQQLTVHVSVVLLLWGGVCVICERKELQQQQQIVLKLSFPATTRSVQRIACRVPQQEVKPAFPQQQTLQQQEKAEQQEVRLSVGLLQQQELRRQRWLLRWAVERQAAVKCCRCCRLQQQQILCVKAVACVLRGALEQQQKQQQGQQQQVEEAGD